MASSDDEGEMVPENVSDYEFISGDNESISFASLPVEWNSGEMHEKANDPIFLSGRTDNGLRKIYKQVIAWKFDLSFDKPQISVLSIENNWITLLKPRKPFEGIIRTILITLQLLHFSKWNPQQSQQALWDHLNRAFSTFDKGPSVDDLVNHLSLIKEVVKRDDTLAKSKIVNTLLEEKRSKSKIINEIVKPPFINDNLEGYDKTDENGDGDNQEGFDDPDDSGDDDKDDCFDSVCAICDNGGNIYICDGKCMRAFHATVEAGEESECESLGFTEEELEAIKDVPFICKNCEYKQHQCFACGKMGSSDESSSPEVFCCVNGACGYFYHPHCVAKLLHPGNEAAAEEQKQKIAAGEKFVCPAHKCHVCKELEVRDIYELQFAVCRRCPHVYHRKCLPRGIELEDRGIVQRAWDGLIKNRLLIYCLDHEIDLELSTPVRDHIQFPGPQRKKMNKVPVECSIKKTQMKKGSLGFENTSGKVIPAKPLNKVFKVSSGSKQAGIFRRRAEEPLAGRTIKMQKATNKNDVGKLKGHMINEREMSLGNKLYSTFYAMDSEIDKFSEGGGVHGGVAKTQAKPAARRIDNPFTIDTDTKKRIFKLMKDASSSLTLEQVKEKYKSPSTHTHISNFSVDNVTLGKVEGSIQSLHAALKTLEGGGSIQDARMICGNNLLVQMSRWKDKLKVYLAPFLYGMRYTSFGRHFTKLDKLKEIADMLHSYVQDGDMLVDFCCGSNDFSCVMKKKLDEMGKNCSFKNYDILQPKNDFNFEQRDWMQVRPDELPNGSQLIMGLNPPFGVNASLANKFINKALEFKPKLLILIVPRETERLDAKDCRYNLIWEDDQMFAGRAFYLPGSVDVNDKQIEDWNVNAPVLYLWSHPSWTSKHKAIAEQHGHSSGGQRNLKLEENHKYIQVPSSTMELRDLDKSLVIKAEAPVNNPDNIGPAEKVMASNQEDAPVDRTLDKNNRERGGKNKRKNRPDSMSGEDVNTRKRPVSRHVSPNLANRRSLERSSPKLPEYPQQVHSGRHRHQQQLELQTNFPTYHQPYPQDATVYNGNETLDDVVRRYNLSSVEGPHRQTYSTGAGPSPSHSPRPDYGYPYGSRYMGNMNEEHNLLGQRGSFRPSSYAGPEYTSAFGQENPARNPTSAMQRYASRLDEMNHGQATGGSGMYHPRGARPASSQPGSLGFAPGPYRSYSQQRNSGWLDE
ncbi:Protein ENHANCED DOWNY MILDEW 2 [Striga hermonthica]|uniref:Protein ENHANCED DOWNY MILDEW 2 n=1 Tax=Striga hermonthica TaxID=68872 RepID=A0A9N7NE44_STRHE|nr:Protein ENHANCED DOWNY MILDEW 2 [Striga hermonthica]